MEDRFISNKSLIDEHGPEASAMYEKTRQDISKLEGLTNIDVVQRCYSSVAQQMMEEEYMRINGVKKSTGSICPHKLHGHSCKNGITSCEGHVIPGSDHLNLWIKNGKPYSITSEPYHLDDNILKKIVQFCEDNDLKFVISNSSIHFPTRALFVEYKAKGTV